MALRSRNPERELRSLAGKVEEARGHLDELRRLVAEREIEHDQAFSTLAGDLGLGELTIETYEARRAELQAGLAAARYEVERQELVLRALSERAAPIAHAVAAARVAAAEEAATLAEAEVVAAEAALTRAHEAQAEAEERLAIVRREALDLAAPFDPEIALKAAARATQDEEQIAWYAREPLADGTIPPHLREAVLARRAAQETAEAERRTRQSVPEPVPSELLHDEQSVPQHGRFPRVGSSR